MAAISEELVEYLHFCKGLGKLPAGNLKNVKIRDLKWNILEEDLSLPAAVIENSKLEYNLSWMQNFMDKYGVKFAPHGKTTMCPALFQKQIQHGAWGISLATMHQVKVAHDFGIRKVLLVNQLVGRRNMEIISEIMKSTKYFEFACLIDSVEAVNQLGAFFEERGQVLRVLLEIGVPGGRTGLRDDEQEGKILTALDTWKNSVHLVGVEIYEGMLDTESSIRPFLRGAADRLKKLQSKGHFREDPILITGAGSIWFDVVAEELTQEFSEPKWPPPTKTEADAQVNAQNPVTTMYPTVEVILRPGCYITNDATSYKDAQTRILGANAVAKQFGAGIQQAMRLWAYVQSIPEPELAIVTLGKRDAGIDSGFPIPALHFRPGVKGQKSDTVATAAGIEIPAAPKSASVDVEKQEISGTAKNPASAAAEADKTEKPVTTPAHWFVKKMMDQHLFLKIAAGDDLQVGDMIALDISHPCTNFDKWRSLLVVDEDYFVIDVLQTYF